jgi:hypothetical protein
MDAMSIYDLAFNYVIMFYAVPDITKDIKKEAVNSMASLLSKGWTSGEIQLNMDFFKNKYPDKVLDLNTYFDGRTPKRRNILKPFEYYYHNELRITPPPPKVTVDYNTGEIKREVQPYFLEMRCSYTIEELYDYYLRHENLYDKMEINQAKYIGGLKWLMDKYSLELVLYMIDIANDMIAANDLPPLTSIMDLQNYLRFAQNALNQRVTDVKAAGDDKIVPKARVLPGRNRVLDNRQGE